jgi:hypothetical protein
MIELVDLETFNREALIAGNKMAAIKKSESCKNKRKKNKRAFTKKSGKSLLANPITPRVVGIENGKDG